MATRDALAVFHGRAAAGPARWLKPGFRHVFCAVVADGHWLVFDGRDGRPRLGIAARATVDLAAYYRRHGMTVVELAVGEAPVRGPVMPATCVAAVKRVLAIRSRAITPWGLYRDLTKE